MGEPKYLAYQIKVQGKRWTVFYCSERYWTKRGYDACTLGITECDDKEIYLRIKKFKRETISHELTHAYLWELCLWDLASEAGAERLEEAFCDMWAKYGKRMLKQLDQIVDAFHILSGRKE